MRVLALDTTTHDGSVALVVDESIVEERTGDRSRGHAERLPGDLVDLAAAHDLSLRDIDLFAVASGPGSFTGLRIGIAAIQGAAFVHGKPVVGVPALEALAHAGAFTLAVGGLIAAWMDAHRHEVFAGLYRVARIADGGTRLLEEVEPAMAAPPSEILEQWRARGHAPEAFVGDGAQLYRSLIVAAPVAGMPALAGAVGRLAVERARRGEAVAPAALHPVYVRRPDVEIARDKKWRG